MKNNHSLYYTLAVLCLFLTGKSFGESVNEICEKMINNPKYPIYKTVVDMIENDQSLKSNMDTTENSQYCTKLDSAYDDYIKKNGSSIDIVTASDQSSLIKDCILQYSDTTIKYELDRFKKIIDIIYSCNIGYFDR